MSRVGKLPVPIASGLQVKLEGQKITVQGKTGTLSYIAPREVTLKVEDNAVKVTPVNLSKRARAMWGLSRNLIKTMVHGLDKGYTKTLELVGVGYRAALQGNVLKLNLGFSHDVDYAIPQGIKVNVQKQTIIEISGVDKQQVGQVAAEIRRFRKPEPYKGKGIKYSDEIILRKEGKKK